MKTLSCFLVVLFCEGSLVQNCRKGLSIKLLQIFSTLIHTSYFQKKIIFTCLGKRSSVYSGLIDMLPVIQHCRKYPSDQMIYIFYILIQVSGIFFKSCRETVSRDENSWGLAHESFLKM